MSAEDYDYDDQEHDGFLCPRCQGDGTVDCHCGGDLCVCLNYGEKDCPTCGGDGEVSEDLRKKYLKAQAEMHEAMRKIWKEGQ